MSDNHVRYWRNVRAARCRSVDGRNATRAAGRMRSYLGLLHWLFGLGQFAIARDHYETALAMASGAVTFYAEHQWYVPAYNADYALMGSFELTWKRHTAEAGGVAANSTRPSTCLPPGH